ncbi:MAG TPA: hypothetical protein VF131_08335 [Blastocatellia bacterium]|nr:hypothetical protein [Blastocatellia bacterium]
MKNFNRFFSAATFALLLAILQGTAAQIDKKPYTEWSEKEAEKLLDKSGWAQTQVFTDTSGTFSTGPGRTVNSSQSRSGGINQVNIHIRFLSAKPVRQAISRIMEIRQKNEVSDQMAAQLKSFATSEFPDYVVVTLTVDGSEAGGMLQEATALLNKLSTVDLKNNTYLLIKDQRIFLQEYQAPRRDGLGARLIFPRIVDGKPIIAAESDEVRFVSELAANYKLNMRYKVKEMIYQGKLEY